MLMALMADMKAGLDEMPVSGRRGTIISMDAALLS